MSKRKVNKSKTIIIDGVQYIKNQETGKVYGMPRTVTNRKILRNRLRMLLKAQGYSKVNKLMAHYWRNPEVQKRIAAM